MLISPPGQLKTSLLLSLSEQRGVIGYSDITSTNLVEARDSFASHKAHTMLLYDMQKLYERRADTASNIEGNIRSIMDEGFTTAAFEQSSNGLIQQSARAFVLAAGTPAFYRKHLKSWDESGVSRRMLFSVFSLDKPELLEEAVMQENPIEFKMVEVPIPANLSIPLSMLPANGRLSSDADFIRYCLGKQVEKVPIIIMKKILAVLRWKYNRLKQKDRSREILGEFSESLKGEGASLTL